MFKYLSFFAIFPIFSASSEAKDLRFNNINFIKFAENSCPSVVSPVCGEKNGEKITYNNQCEALKAEASDIQPGKCESYR